jgi:hypothetical protein
MVVPDTEALGAKLRGGLEIELKLLAAVLPPVVVGDCVGRCEQWRKWSLDVAGADLGDVRGLPWLRVDKQRFTRRYPPAADREAAGCDAELTRLAVDGVPWWSLAFEAYGQGQERARAFASATAAVLAKPGLPMTFEERNSFGYPRWLRLVSPPSG